VGTAEFDVAKDALRPFTVYTGRLSTTALGTRFKIDAASQNKFVKVKLMEGKVVLRSTEMKDVYLMPGQQCKFEIATGYAKVSPFDNEDQKNGINGLKKTSLNPNKAGSLAFVQKPLSVVFEKIGEQFNVKIESSDMDINSISFTGTFFPSDSLGNVLTIICASNDLSFERKHNNHQKSQ
jgi:ferric-dicitrate binding protein FerR (iron transport regulator)